MSPIRKGFNSATPKPKETQEQLKSSLAPNFQSTGETQSMKIRTDTGKRRAHINVKRREDGKPGLVVSQGGSTVLMSRDEWLTIRNYADTILGITD